MANFSNNHLVEEGVEAVRIPAFVKIRQLFDVTALSDVPAAVAQAVDRRGLRERIKPGQRVAITAGSRQIANMPLILRSLGRIVKECGASPFVIPAMGSHGGATAEGQLGILHHYGITEQAIEMPIISSMQVEQIGTTGGRLPVYCSSTLIHEADAIILCNRIKPHPGLFGPIQSGLTKISVIGCGKQRGAETCHRAGLSEMEGRLKEMSRIIIDKMPVLFGLGILENAYDQTAELHAIPAELIAAEEPALLKRAQSYMPCIIPGNLDVLVVDEGGKNISGVCADPAVTLRYLVDEKRQQNTRREPSCFVLCDLTDESEGAASGVGQADIITHRLYEKIDFGKTYVNAMTSTFLPNSKLPIVMKDDRTALKLAIKTCNAPDPDRLRIVRIKNTLSVQEIYVSEALLPEVEADERLEPLTGPLEARFDESGNLVRDWSAIS